MNQKNSLELDSCFKDLEDPLALFTIWLAEAEKKEINDPNALSLATTNSKNEPSVRMVLLKGLSSKGFVFYTNLNSPKSNDLKKNPKAEMCFHWKSLQRQIRIYGSIAQIDDKEADKYFSSTILTLGSFISLDVAKDIAFGSLISFFSASSIHILNSSNGSSKSLKQEFNPK